MTILTMDGFDSPLTPDDVLFQDSIWTFRGTAASIQAGGGRWGGQALRVTGSNGEGLRSGNLNTSNGIDFRAGSQLGVRLHFLFNGLLGATNRVIRLSYSPSTSTAYELATVSIASDGSVTLYTSGVDPEIFPVGTIVEGGYYYLALDVQGESSGGAADGWIKVRLNGTTVTLNDQTFASTSTYLHIGLDIDSTELLVDDVVVADHHMTDLVPHRIHSLAPNADRAQADFIPLSGTDGFAMVDEQPHDGDTSYVVASTVGDTSEYEYAALGTSLGIYALKFHAVAKRDTSGTNDARHELRLSTGTVLAGADQPLLDDTYRFDKSGVLEQNPDTASAFTETEVNGLYSRHEVI
ncbi:hypothetical protein [Halomonas stenophila]|uniref:3D (Asp-Asp-Asp) domain-containing protein n=1 Tax=Halomonas stenophila TaxID=795312 RepID=A0A7W5EUI1_9GAMM|nr:hypothetical protein [Halomonas stenophila]MBB3231694.1 3D (Asp-Asp-Asp) domain-containing protein [Halomonas stenophila]